MVEFDMNEIDLSREAPVMEPQRQYYYIAKCRQELLKKSKELGRSLTMSIQTFGCQMNSRDSEKISGILKTIGYVETDSEQADFVLYNTCTVRENANNRLYGRLGYTGKQKKKNPYMMIVLCGCMMQEAAAVEKIKKKLSFCRYYIWYT